MTYKPQSNHKHIYINQRNIHKQNCKCFFYSKQIIRNVKPKLFIHKSFSNKIDALCYKFIISLRIKANHNMIKYANERKRNLWYK